MAQNPRDLVVGQTYRLDELSQMFGVEMDEDSRIVVPGLGIPYAVVVTDLNDGWWAICPVCNVAIETVERKDEESFTKAEYRAHYEEQHGGEAES